MHSLRRTIKERKLIMFLKDLTGERSGRIVITGFHKKIKGLNYWNYLCDCGITGRVSVCNFNSGAVKSCGCGQKESASKTKIKHGFHRRNKRSGEKERFYEVWSGIVKRTGNKKSLDYKYYGGRGIINLWQKFENFRDDMYESYLKHIKEFGEKQTTIDRINVNDNYYKKNCRWATRDEQAKNKRINYAKDI